MTILISKKHRKKAIILNFGTGGHTEQMKRLLSHINTKGLVLIAQSPTLPNDKRYNEYIKILKVRPDYVTLSGILSIPFSIFGSLIQTFKLFFRYEIHMIISTGPGIAIIPSIIAKLFGAKVLFFESWCRFSSPSISGRIMYYISDSFFVQNEEVKQFYKKSIHIGRL